MVSVMRGEWNRAELILSYNYYELPKVPSNSLL